MLATACAWVASRLVFPPGELAGDFAAEADGAQFEPVTPNPLLYQADGRYPAATESAASNNVELSASTSQTAAELEPPLLPPVVTFASPLAEYAVDPAPRWNQDIQLVAHQAPPPQFANRQPPPTAELIGPVGQLTFQFQAAPWDLVLRRFAAEAGLALEVDVLPPGTLTYFDEHPHTPTEALDILNSALVPRGFVLIRNGRVARVVKIDGGVPPALVPQINVTELESRGWNELLTVDIPVVRTNATVAANEVKPLLSPLGKAIPLTGSNRLVVTDMGGNLRRIYRLLWPHGADASQRPNLVYRLKNTPALDVAKAVNEFLASSQPARPGGAPPAGPGGGPVPVEGLARDAVVVAEATTNSILVNASQPLLADIERIIAQLDQAPEQVVIQALLVEVQLGSTDEFGVELGVQDSVLFDRSVVNNLVTNPTTNTSPNGVQTTTNQIISQTAQPGFNFNNQPLGNNTSVSPATVGSQALSSLALGRVNSNLGFGGLVLSASSDSVSVLLRALAARTKVDILSRPQIRTLDNHPAEIQIGQQVPVVDGVSVTPVGSANPIIRQDQAGIILRVVPHISPEGEVAIEVTAEKSQFQLAAGTGVPIFTDAKNGNVVQAPIKDVTKARTTVSMLNGQTIVLGGMITKSTNKVERKLPYLGDVPYLGWLFRYDLEQVARSELLIFLTPQVIHCAADSERIREEEINRTKFPAADATQIDGRVPPGTPAGPIDPTAPGAPGTPPATTEAPVKEASRVRKFFGKTMPFLN
jgi:type II secretory pathway component GspD/PulD (secretin)